MHILYYIREKDYKLPILVISLGKSNFYLTLKTITLLSNRVTIKKLINTLTFSHLGMTKQFS